MNFLKKVEKILKHAWSVQLSPFLNEHRDMSYILQPQLESGETVWGRDELPADNGGRREARRRRTLGRGCPAPASARLRWC